MDWISTLVLLAVFVLICPVAMYLMMRRRKHAAAPAATAYQPETASRDIHGDRADAGQAVLNRRASERGAP